MYTTFNYKSKKALIADLKAGKEITYFQPGPFRGNEPRDGKIVVEGPHYPSPHRFYAECEVKDGKIVKVK